MGEWISVTISRLLCPRSPTDVLVSMVSMEGGFIRWHMDVLSSEVDRLGWDPAVWLKWPGPGNTGLGKKSDDEMPQVVYDVHDEFEMDEINGPDSDGVDNGTTVLVPSELKKS